jgi:phospholipase/carboxylesterase
MDNAAPRRHLMTLLEAVEFETAPSPRFSVIWLHGLGADGHDFEPIVPELVRRNWPGIRFVFPHAQQRPVTINGGMRMRAWYDISGKELEHKQDEAGVRASMVQVNALLDRETARGVPPERQFLVGFSQGGAITLSCLIRRTQPLAGAIALSTYLPIADKSQAEATEVSKSIPIFLGHGSMDPVVALGLGAMSREWLQRAGYKVNWHSYPMPHSVCAEEIRDIADFMQPILLAGA